MLVLFSCDGMILCKPTKGGHAGMSKSNIVSQQSQLSREMIFIQHIKLCIKYHSVPIDQFSRNTVFYVTKTVFFAQTIHTATTDKWSLMEGHRYFKCATSQN